MTVKLQIHFKYPAATHLLTPGEKRLWPHFLLKVSAVINMLDVKTKFKIKFLRNARDKKPHNMLYFYLTQIHKNTITRKTFTITIEFHLTASTLGNTTMLSDRSS